ARRGSQAHPTVEWPRGEATDCKSVYEGSNPFSTSTQHQAPPRAIGAVVARFLDTEEVTGSNPVSPTREIRLLTWHNTRSGAVCMPGSFDRCAIAPRPTGAAMTINYTATES